VLAYCLNSWEQLGLAVTRLTIIGAAATTVALAWRSVLRTQIKIVPRPIWAFTGAWAALLLGLAVYAFVNCGRTPPVWYTALYGSAFVWTIIGLLWVVLISQHLIRNSIRTAEQAAERAAKILCDHDHDPGT
jgi:hypothetical protein